MNCEVSEINNNNTPIKGIKIIGDKAIQRNAMHTIVLLDISGSMNQDNKLVNVKKSLNFLVKFLQSSDHLSLITFNHISQIMIQNMNVTPDYITTFHHIINTLMANGGTNLSAGLLNVKSVLERCVDENLKTGLIILTDGHTNEGIISKTDILRIVESIKTVLPSISITTIGYNDDHNAELLKSIAVNGAGSYNIVNNSDQVATVFGEILGGLMSTVVQNCYVKYDSSWETLNMYPTTKEGYKTIIYIGDITAESETILLFKNTNTSSVEVGGVSTKDFSTITHNLDFTHMSQNTESYYIAYIRFQIAYILENLNNLTNETVINRLKPIKDYLDIPLNALHPLVSYLRREISSIEEQVEYPVSMNNTQNLQQSMCLAFGRGTSSQRVLLRRQLIHHYDIDSAPNNASNINIMITPFSNTAQREVSQCAVEYTQADIDDPME